MSLQDRLSALVNSLGSDHKRAHGVSSTITTASLTPNASTHQFNVTALASGLTINAPGGTPLDGQSLIIRIRDDGTARDLTWNGVFHPIGVELPATTVSGKTLYVGAKWNSSTSSWDVLAVGQEA